MWTRKVNNIPDTEESSSKLSNNEEDNLSLIEE
jgi:hypothetical protein